MNKEYTDNDIVTLLKRVSTELEPSESSFAVLLQKLETQEIASPTPLRERPQKIIHKNIRPHKSHMSPYGSMLKVASACMAVFVVYIGISNVSTDTKVKEIVSLNTGSENISLSPSQSIANGEASQAVQKIALQQKNNTPSDVVELGSALENELLAEVEANTDLFAISDSL